MKRIALAASLVLVGIVLAGALSAGRACAHDPRFACSPRPASNPIVVEDPAKSWAFYGDLAAGQEDRYTVIAHGALRVPVQVLLDARDAANPARPIALVTGSANRLIARLDLSKSTAFYEPFSRVSYLASPGRTIALEAGTSTVVVSMRGGSAPQRYVFAIGSEERFGVAEMPYLLGAVYRIHQRKF